MKIISIGTDRKLFDESSPVFARQVSYASKVKELHIIVFSLKKHNLPLLSKGNLCIYPTNSSSKIFYIKDAVTTAKNILFSRPREMKEFVISTQDPFETGFVGYRLKQKFKIPLQLQIHTDFLSYHFKNSILNRIRVFISKIVIPKADGIRVVSSVISDSIKIHFKNLKTKIDVLPVFIDIDEFINTYPKRDIRKDYPQFKFIILMASRLSSEKKIDTAIKAMVNIVQVSMETGLVICGAGKEKNKLQSLVNKLKLSDNVVFAGWQEDLVSYYKTASLFLLTSEYEGYGMTLIEAGACGCPIITTKVGIAKTDLFKNGENCFIFPVGDDSSLSKNVLDLISDNAKRDAFKHKMQSNIKNVIVSKDEYISQYVNLLENLIKND